MPPNCGWGWKHPQPLPARTAPCLGGGEHVGLRAVDADGNLRAGGAELLEEAAVRPDPQVVLRDLHLSSRAQTATCISAWGHLWASLEGSQTRKEAPKKIRGSSRPKGGRTAVGLGTRLRGDFGALGALRLPTHDARSDELPHSAPFCSILPLFLLSQKGTPLYPRSHSPHCMQPWCLPRRGIRSPAWCRGPAAAW